MNTGSRSTRISPAHIATSGLSCGLSNRRGKIPAIAAKIKKLEARSAAIIRRLQVPYPTKYGEREAKSRFFGTMMSRGVSILVCRRLQGVLE